MNEGNMFRYLLVFLLLSLLFGACTTEKQSKEALEHELRQAVAAFNTAFKSGERALIEPYIAKEYLHSNGTNKAIGRTTWLNYIAKREQQTKNGEMVIDHYNMTEQQVLLYDDYGIITGRVEVAGKNKEGDFKNAYRVTNIWLKENGQWKRTGFHDGKIQN